MKYKKISLNEKRRIVGMVVDDHLSIAEAGRKTNLPDTTISMWLRNPKINLDAEYVKLLEEKASRRKPNKNPKDPFPEGVVMAARTNPDELARENKDLRKKVAYLEDKIAYLETLYSILKEDPAKISKKKDLRPSSDSSSGDGQT